MPKKITSSIDELMMRRVLVLAKRGMGHVHPNPMVGCVLVKNNRVIAEGYHRKFGAAHAEIDAINHAKRSVGGATLYVNLEPCSHTGKTPPCADFLISVGIARVVVGCQDPNPRVSGKGIQKLRSAGICVDVGILKHDCEELNKDFFYWVRHRRPYVVLKIAQTLDGKIATSTGDSKWISSEPSRVLAHNLRAESDAVLVGIKTVLQDNPYLNTRMASISSGNIHKPIKIVLDSYLRTPLHSNLFSKKSPAPVILAASAVAVKKFKNKFSHKAMLLPITEKKGNLDLKELMRVLANRGIVRVLVEGGAQVSASMIRAGLANEIVCFIAPKIAGADAKSGVGNLGIKKIKQSLHLRKWHAETSGDDWVIRGTF